MFKELSKESYMLKVYDLFVKKGGKIVYSEYPCREVFDLKDHSWKFIKESEAYGPGWTSPSLDAEHEFKANLSEAVSIVLEIGKESYIGIPEIPETDSSGKFFGVRINPDKVRFENVRVR